MQIFGSKVRIDSTAKVAEIELTEKVLLFSKKLHKSITLMYHTWENFGGGKFDEWYIMCQIFLANINKYSRITDRLPADLPTFSLPIASLAKNFPLQNFSTYGTAYAVNSGVIFDILTLMCRKK